VTIPTMTPLIASTGSRVADWLWYAAHTILGVMPVVMAIGHRSSTLVIAVATAAAVAAMAFETRLREWLVEAAEALRTPLGLAVLAFLGFAALSMFWSIAPGVSFRAYAEFVLTLGGVFVLGFALPRRMPRAGPLLLATSVAVACIVIMLDLWTDLAVRRTLGVRSFSFIFNRPVLTLLVLMIPLLWLLGRRGHVRVAAGVLALVTATILHSDSRAALLGLLAGLAAYALARRASRFGISLLACCLAAAVMLAPLTGVVAERVVPSSVHQTLESANSRARIEIWKRFGEAVQRAPVVGSGFGASPSFAETNIAQQIAAAGQIPVNDPAVSILWHPHNAALQVWFELGAVGTVLGMIVLMLLLTTMATFPHEVVAVSLALAAAVTAVSLVGHGAWQGWWAAAIGAAVVWLRYDASHLSDHRP
jgi:exopolysaccharide production protein ExoQ